MIFILLIGLIIELVYCYYIFNKDLFSPSAILCEVFILSTIACIFNIDKWGVDLGVDTLAVILLGNAVFIFVSTIIHRIYQNKHAGPENKKSEGLKYINTSWIILFLVTVAYIIFSAIYIKTNVSILGDLSQSGDMSHAMALYRHETAGGDGVLPTWLIKMNTVFNAGLYILIYIFINNFIVDKKKKSNYLLLLAIVLYLFSSVFTAQRTTILLAFIYAMFVAYSLLNRKYQFVQKINTKYILKGALVVIAFLVLFGTTRSLFGRNDDNSAFDNVTYYMGNSIESLDLFIKDPLESTQFGEETFRQFRVNLSKYGLAEPPASEKSFLEFRQDANGNTAGNVYTGYRHYIYDFGYGSIILLQAALAIFYGVWYEKLNRRELKDNVDLSFVFYVWFCLALFRFSITNEGFNKIASFLFVYWFLFLFWKLLLGSKISLKRQRKSISEGQPPVE